MVFSLMMGTNWQSVVGCIEADLAISAKKVQATTLPLRITYGNGSHFYGSMPLLAAGARSFAAANRTR